MHTFANYYEWRSAITGPCGLALTAAYCAERLKDLQNASIPSTRAFVDAYGEGYLEAVISWFRQAESEAKE
jgi:hypothetical protein